MKPEESMSIKLENVNLREECEEDVLYSDGPSGRFNRGEYYNSYRDGRNQHGKRGFIPNSVDRRYPMNNTNVESASRGFSKYKSFGTKAQLQIKVESHK